MVTLKVKWKSWFDFNITILILKIKIVPISVSKTHQRVEYIKFALTSKNSKFKLFKILRLESNFYEHNVNMIPFLVNLKKKQKKLKTFNQCYCTKGKLIKIIFSV